MTFGKVMGGGFPAAAFGGRADVMARLAPAGPVYQAGTLSGNPVATAAGLATLRAADDDVYAWVDKAAGELQRAGRRRAHRRPVWRTGVQHAGNMFSVFFADGRGDRLRRRPPSGDLPLHRRSSTRCSARGVYLPPSAFESWFVSAAHDDAALERVADALPHAARAAAAATPPESTA